LISNPAFSNSWRSIIKFNVNILCSIDCNENNEIWSGVVSSLNANTLFCIFLQQPFEEYSQEALKLLNNLIVDIPELATQVPTDFIDIFVRCIDEFSCDQARNSLRLCFGVIYQGNVEFTDLFVDQLFPRIQGFMSDCKELQDYFCLSFAKVIECRESIPTQKNELIERINEYFLDSLEEWCDAGSQKALEFSDYLLENAGS
jgi:hypothetical protein